MPTKTWQRIALIALITSLFTALEVGLVAAVLVDPSQVWIAVIFAPILLLFGWFWYPLALVLVSVFWYVYTPAVSLKKGNQALFVISSTVIGTIPFLFFGLIHPGVDPVISGLAGTVGALLIIQFKKPFLKH